MTTNNQQPQLGTCPTCGSDDKAIYNERTSFRYGRWRAIDGKSCAGPRHDPWHAAAPQARPAPPPPKMIAITTTPSDDSWARDAFVAAGEAQGEAPAPDEARIALKQWENDTHQAATAPEGIAFMDGFYAGRARVDAGAHPAPEQDVDLKREAACIAEYLLSKGRTMPDDDYGMFEAGWLAARFYDIEARAAHPESRGAALTVHEALLRLRDDVEIFIQHDGGEGSIDYDAARIFKARNAMLRTIEKLRAAPPSSPGAPHSEGDQEPTTCPGCQSVKRKMIYKGWGDETYLRNYFACRHPWHSDNKPAFAETNASSPGADTEKK